MVHTKPVPHSGFTLIEMVMSLTIGSLVVLLAAGLIHKTFQLSKGAQARSELSNGFDRMVDSLRTDLYSASSYQVAEDGSSLEVVIGDRIWVYRSQGEYLERSSAGVEQTKTLERIRLNGSVINARHREVQFSQEGVLVSLRLFAINKDGRILERVVRVMPGRWAASTADSSSGDQSEDEEGEASVSSKEGRP